MRVIGYCRVSSSQQAEEGVSLAAQEVKLRQYAELYGHELVAIITDAGESAKTLKRPGIQQALGALELGEAEGLLVCKLDRLTRSVKDLGTLLERYFASRFALFSVGDAIDTTSAAGRLVLNILGSVAQWEREAISERTRTALQHLKAQGRQLGGPRYQNQQALQRIRELAADGFSQRRIVATLNQEGVPTMKGRPWAQSSVSKLLARI